MQESPGGTGHEWNDWLTVGPWKTLSFAGFVNSCFSRIAVQIYTIVGRLRNGAMQILVVQGGDGAVLGDSFFGRPLLEAYFFPALTLAIGAGGAVHRFVVSSDAGS